ncbi:AGC family protein kinase [Trichomonas vaginalis G3]|uniref:AGC family protein kinase n=1 Tax=Trichomonas vaginalis (strain ATCC PRA-98 / G3) TaxID=412133 RepID=A2GCF7_TRIV3|nr:regulation of centriole replication [Trichomonas vaginalis G3]EAX85159.1 AGC family protein kinase [Trichomonas vaginalis G3]KAI5504625.1 regulation of centriole replication [Trichomonas vaginalis G3]|eukprot:XP_001298089.1 AGC family protein kinase [Trichomonas vaginalis G3]
MNYRELEFFGKNGLRYEKVIARGANGLIYLVYSESQQRKFAMKKYPQFIFKDKDLENIIAINNPHLLKFTQYFKFNDQVYLLMEYCPTNLEKLITEPQMVSKEILRNYIYDVVTCVKTCHDNNISISDFTLSNFLIDENGKIKINFLSLKHIVQEQEENAPARFKTMNYFLPPEVIEQSEYDEMCSDIWSLGCILYFMASKSLPFNSKDMKSLKDQIKKCEYNNEKVEDLNLREVISRCLKIDPNSRTTVGNLLKMKYFGKLDTAKNNQKAVLKSEWRKSVYLVRRNMTFINYNRQELDIPNTPSRPSEGIF